MSVAAISGAAAQTARAGSGFADLTTDKFIRVLLSELSNQDPFQPQDSAKLLEQFSSLRNIESQLKLQESLQGMVLQWQIGAAGNLIGSIVQGLDAANNSVEGLVTSVRVQGGKAMLELDTGQTLAMDRVTKISALWL